MKNSLKKHYLFVYNKINKTYKRERMWKLRNKARELTGLQNTEDIHSTVCMLGSSNLAKQS